MVNEKPKSLFQRIFRLGSEQDKSQVVSDSNSFADMPTPKHTIIGSPGTEIYSGYVQEEYLSTLRSERRCEVYDQMRRSDGQVKMCLSAVKGPIKKAKWTVDPASEDDGVDAETAKADAELIEQILFKDMNWKRFVREALTVLEFGVAPFEITHRAVMNHPKFGSYNSIRQLGWRSPRTIIRFNVDPAEQVLASISQQAFGDLAKSVDIPAEYLLMLVLDQEGANYEGVSALRSVYGNWFRKNVYQKLNAIGIEKSAVPAAIGKYPAGQQGSPAYTKFVNVLRAFTSHEAQYITVPNDWDVTLQSNTYDPQKTEASIDNEDKRMAKAFLANFLELGMNGTGSFALSNDISDFFLSSLDALADLICEEINLCLIPQLIKMNRGPRAAYPTVKAAGISDKAGKELAEIFEILSRAGFVPATDEPTREFVRDRFGLPKPAEAAALLPAPPPAPGTPPPAPADPTKLSLSERVRLARESRRSKV